MSRASTRGILVAFEGIDGAGKTTQVKRLAGRLGEQGVPFVATKEPTDGSWGAKIRTSAQSGRMSAEDELQAFLHDRREHVATVIAPALAEGKVVVVDRYYLSTVAYQGARGLSPARLLRENAFAPPPDILIVLDIEPALGLQRIRQRGDRADLFEREDELHKAREIFRTLTVANLHVLDGTKEPAALSRHITTLLFDKLAVVAPER
ncbi:MAG: dTMP kinase [Proteobacteria bacterium]|nr:dTMP kinase [Pseudomonadota bacterium]